MLDGSTPHDRILDLASKVEALALTNVDRNAEERQALRERLEEIVELADSLFHDMHAGHLNPEAAEQARRRRVANVTHLHRLVHAAYEEVAE